MRVIDKVKDSIESDIMILNALAILDTLLAHQYLCEQSQLAFKEAGDEDASVLKMIFMKVVVIRPERSHALCKRRHTCKDLPVIVLVKSLSYIDLILPRRLQILYLIKEIFLLFRQYLLFLILRRLRFLFHHLLLDPHCHFIFLSFCTFLALCLFAEIMCVCHVVHTHISCQIQLHSMTEVRMLISDFLRCHITEAHLVEEQFLTTKFLCLFELLDRDTFPQQVDHTFKAAVKSAIHTHQACFL